MLDVTLHQSVALRIMGSGEAVAMRSRYQGSDLPTLLVLLLAVVVPALLVSLVLDLPPRGALEAALRSARERWFTETSPAATPVLVAPQPAPSPSPIRLASADWPLPDGHFFTQTNGREPLSSATGFAVTNVAGIRFWDEVQRLGGVAVVGYPLSNRFVWRGFTVQVFQKVVLQAPEEGGEIALVNVMDELSALGKDEMLERERLVPRPLGPEFDAGRSPVEISERRLALLAADPVLEAAYRQAPDPLRLYGLPTSEVRDMGDYLIAIRCQRTVLQHWKRDVPWARAGEVTAANAGQLAIEAGLFPREALAPTVVAPSGTAPERRP